MACKTGKDPATGRDFEALPRDQRERIVAELEAASTAELLARSQPLTRSEAAAERRLRDAVVERRRRGRPKIGKGSKLVAVTLEQGLREEADRFARRRKMNRSEMIASGLRLAHPDGCNDFLLGQTEFLPSGLVAQGGSLTGPDRIAVVHGSPSFTYFMPNSVAAVATCLAASLREMGRVSCKNWMGLLPFASSHQSVQPHLQFRIDPRSSRR
jgi:hypothetical protein